MGDYRVLYGDEPITFSVRNRSDIHHKVAIHVQPDGRVIIDAPPQTPNADIKQALLKRARWVKKQLAIIETNSAHVLPREYVSGETHWYLGKRYLLKVRHSSSAEAQARLLRGMLVVNVPSIESQLVRDTLEQWYRARAQEVFARRLAVLFSRMQWVNSLPEWKTRHMSKQWGSCSTKGRLSLNPKLVKAPPTCIDYVIVHELCHLQHHNHSKAYYRLLEQTLPDWKATKQRLDNMAELLLI